MAWSGVLLVMIIFLHLAAKKWPVLDDLVGLLGILFLHASSSSSFCLVAFSYFKVFLIWLLLAVFVLFDATTRYKYNLFTKRVESILSCLEDNSVTGCLNPWCTRCPQYEPSTLKATQSHSWFFLHGCSSTNIFFRLFNLQGIDAQSGTFLARYEVHVGWGLWSKKTHSFESGKPKGMRKPQKLMVLPDRSNGYCT